MWVKLTKDTPTHPQIGQMSRSKKCDVYIKQFRIQQDTTKKNTYGFLFTPLTFDSIEQFKFCRDSEIL